MKSKISGRKFFLIFFFALQILGIVIGRFSNEKYFCWAPYDEISFYKIDATVNGVVLDGESIRDRYRKNKTGRENRSIHNVISIIRQYETTYGKNDTAAIELSYVVNGHKERTWIWPEDKIISK